MIDTICLLIPHNKVISVDLTDQGTPNWSLQSRTEQYDKFVKNPSKRDLTSGLYFPRLTGYKRKWATMGENVKIEFSAPKLLYLNNLDELEDKDFPQIIDTLQERLKAMGIMIEKETLINASVSSAHFSRNIKLEDNYTASYLISEINKVNLNKTFDLSRTRYVNNGQSLYAHATSHQLVIYDKIADLGKDPKRAIDKDQTKYQRDLFELFINDKTAEVLRFEIRLSQKQKMSSVLEKLGLPKNPTFKDVFNSEVSRKVVEQYWKNLIKEKNLGLFSISLSLKEVLRILYLNDKEIKPKQAMYLVGLFMLGKDENGMRELRSIIGKNQNDRTWYRITRDMKLVSEVITKNNLRNWVVQIDNKLKTYEPYKANRNSQNIGA